MNRLFGGFALLMVIAFPSLGAGGGFVIPVTIGNVTSAVASPDDKTSILTFLREYESTLASGRVEQIVALYGDFDQARQADLQRYFDELIRDLSVRLDDIHIDVAGDMAKISFDRNDRFQDRQTGRQVEKSIRLARKLERDGLGWRMFLDGH